VLSKFLTQNDLLKSNRIESVKKRNNFFFPFPGIISRILLSNANHTPVQFSWKNRPCGFKCEKFERRLASFKFLILSTTKVLMPAASLSLNGSRSWGKSPFCVLLYRKAFGSETDPQTSLGTTVDWALSSCFKKHKV
jgi:hypothetical protein